MGAPIISIIFVAHRKKPFVCGEQTEGFYYWGVLGVMPAPSRTHKQITNLSVKQIESHLTLYDYDLPLLAKQI